MTELTARQKEIIDVAIKLMARGGIQRLTMKNISKQMGISEPAIYRHFGSKMDILFSMLAQFKHRSGEHLRRARVEQESALRQLETIFLEHVGQFAVHPHMTAVVFSEEAFQDEQRLAQEIFSVMSLAYDTLVDITASGQEAGEIRLDVPKEHLTLMVLGSLRLLVKRWRLSGYSFDLRQESALVWQSLRTMLACSTYNPVETGR